MLEMKEDKDDSINYNNLNSFDLGTKFRQRINSVYKYMEV